MAKAVWCQKWGAGAQHDAMGVKVNPTLWWASILLGVHMTVTSVKEVAVLYNTGKSSPGCPCLWLPFLEPPRLFCDLPLLRFSDRSSKCKDVPIVHSCRNRSVTWAIGTSQKYLTVCVALFTQLSQASTGCEKSITEIIILERRLKAQCLQAGSDNPA